MRPASSPTGWLAQPAAVRYGLPLALLFGLSVLRTHGIADTFWLHADQSRDWAIALGPWHELPLSGTPSTVGGRAVGPVFYWTLWVIRVVIGPFTENLPHAGGIGLSIIQSCADAVLFVAIWSRLGSTLVALAVVLLGATSPFDVALSATIWNPPLAVAFVKLAMAVMLIGGDRPVHRWAIAATSLGWLAVQAHSAAVFVALPIMGSFVVRELGRRRWGSAVQFARTIAETVFVLQIPFLVDLILRPSGSAAPTRVMQDVARTLSDPTSLRLGESVREIGAAFHLFLFMPWEIGWFVPAALIVAAVALWRVRRDLALAAVSIGPIACVVAGFATWQGAFDSYWFLPLLPPFVLMVMLAVTALPSRRAVAILSGAVIVLVLVIQPARFQASRRLFRMPEYGALVQGSREVARRMQVVRALEVRFPLAATVDPLFLYTKVFAGRIVAEAEYVAAIERSGHAEFRRAP